MIASHWGYRDMVSVLLSHKAEVNQQDVSHRYLSIRIYSVVNCVAVVCIKIDLYDSFVL